MTERYDLYGPIHKGLRRALSTLLMRLGANDWTDTQETGELLAALRRQLVLSALHLEDEDRFIHPALARKAPPLAVSLAFGHDHHRDTMRKLAAICDAIDGADVADRPALGRDLYLAFSRFVAEDFAHMLEEETIVQPQLHALFSDEELMAIEGAIVGSLPHDDLLDFLRLMLPAMNPSERAAFLSGIRAGAPAEMFELVIGAAARQSLDLRAWRRLERDMALAA